MKAKSYKWVSRPFVGGYLNYRFGPNFAQISVDTTLKLKSSIKDVARVLHGKVPEDIEALTRKLPPPPQGVSDDSFVYGYEDGDGVWVPGLVETDPQLKAYTERYPKDWEYVQKCLGVPRQKGRHACLLGGEAILLFEDGQILGKEIDKCTQTVTVPTGQGALAEATLLYQGEREVVEYTLDNQTVIRCTPDHKVLTSVGWMEIALALAAGAELLGPDLTGSAQRPKSTPQTNAAS